MYFVEDDYDSEEEYYCLNNFNYVPSSVRGFTAALRRHEACQVASYIEKREMAESNAAKLIAEDEKEKTQAEKKREKKKKKREKKQTTQQESSTAGYSDAEEKEQEKERKTFTIVKTSRRNIRQEEDKEEEALDPSCAFISEVAVKKKIVTMPESRNKNNKKVNANDSGLQLKRMIEDGLRFVEQDCYEEAAKVYTEIIQLHPNVYAFYGNRSYCNERLGKYNLALEDANKALSLNSKGAVNHYRKASALFGLKKFSDAEIALVRVLKIDPKCSEAKEDLIIIRKIKLLEMGFNDRMSDFGARNYESLDEAIADLVKRSAKDFEGNTDQMNDIYVSEDEDTEEFLASTKNVADTLELNPTNPRKLKVLWVGNLSVNVTEQQIKTLFSKYGFVEQVMCTKTALNEKQYAFVNYRDVSSPGKAMIALQGHVLGTSEMLIKFPIKKLTNDTSSANNVDKKLKEANIPVLPVNGDECWFWRARGFCYHENNCRYKHVKAHRNIDRAN